MADDFVTLFEDIQALLSTRPPANLRRRLEYLAGRCREGLDGSGKGPTVPPADLSDAVAALRRAIGRHARA